MALKARIQDDMKSALKAKETARLAALRLLFAAIRQAEIDGQQDLTENDDGVLAIVNKLVKQRKDSASQYEAAGRAELAAAERAEIDVLSSYLPAALSAEELAAAIDRALADTGARAMADMGKVMAILKPQLAGRADLAEVSRTVRARLHG
ncbi:MAG: GatB/YqeY domain-containing protein [Rhodocyclaceae bacterium]|nr:GatB/YqeY domain-containing protein [Rhodocyclaceae bacterium]